MTKSRFYLDFTNVALFVFLGERRFVIESATFAKQTVKQMSVFCASQWEIGVGAGRDLMCNDALRKLGKLDKTDSYSAE